MGGTSLFKRGSWRPGPTAGVLRRARGQAAPSARRATWRTSASAPGPTPTRCAVWSCRPRLRVELTAPDGSLVDLGSGRRGDRVVGTPTSLPRRDAASNIADTALRVVGNVRRTLDVDSAGLCRRGPAPVVRLVYELEPSHGLHCRRRARDLRAAVAAVAGEFGPDYWLNTPPLVLPPTELWSAMGKQGFPRVNIPEEYAAVGWACRTGHRLRGDGAAGCRCC